MTYAPPLARTAQRENPACESELVASLFAPSAIACELRGTADPSMLFPEEAVTCDALRPKRLADFAAGRLCARGALTRLGFPDFPLRRNADRTACWPDGVVGSITHTVGFCGAVVERRENVAALGLDAEIVAGVVPEIWPQVLTALESAALKSLARVESERFAAIAFCAKEAFYKCQFGLTAGWLDFLDVSVETQAESEHSGAFVVRAASVKGRHILRGLEAEGRYRFAGPLVLAGIALARQAAQQLAPRSHLSAV